MISVIILTKNEEQDLPKCLKSIEWCDDILLLDSGSTDNTTNIASKYGVKVYTNNFESFGKQRNFALDNISTKYEWILFLDADECSTPEFYTNLISSISKAGSETSGYYCCWKMILEGTWLKRCDNFPKWQLRLLRKGKIRFIDFGHGQKEDVIEGDISFIQEPYLHFSFSKGWTDWISKHNKYSTQEAIARTKNIPPFVNIFNKNSSIRNPALKSWFSKIPGWPLVRFFYSYILKLGFIEGKAGLNYCVNMAYYEFLIQIKITELKSKM